MAKTNYASTEARIKELIAKCEKEKESISKSIEQKNAEVSVKEAQVKQILESDAEPGEYRKAVQELELVKSDVELYTKRLEITTPARFMEKGETDKVKAEVVKTQNEAYKQARKKYDRIVSELQSIGEELEQIIDNSEEVLLSWNDSIEKSFDSTEWTETPCYIFRRHIDRLNHSIHLPYGLAD